MTKFHQRVAMNNYWMVGSMPAGKVENDALEDFITRGYRYGWEKSTSPLESQGSGNSVKNQRERFNNIKEGDRIAIKKIISIPDQKMEVRAIGIVKDIDHGEWRIYVNWLPIIEKNVPRIVDLKGCTASIHGPFQRSDPWVHEIFCA